MDIQDLLDEQEKLTNEERLELWWLIQEGYCRYCGEVTNGEVCHCINDE